MNTGYAWTGMGKLYWRCLSAGKLSLTSFILLWVYVGLCEFRTRLVSFCHTLCVQNVKIHFTRIYGHWPPPTPRHHHIFIYTICTIYACGICACLWLFLGIYTLITHTHTCSGRNENIMLHFIRGALIHIPTSLNALQPLKID